MPTQGTIITVFSVGLALFLIASNMLENVKHTEYKFTPIAKDCLAEIKTSEKAMRILMPEESPFSEDNQLVLSLFACIFQSNVNDDNELVIDKNLEDYVTEIISIRLHQGTEKLAALIAYNCLHSCKHVPTGTNKGQTAVKVMNCVKDRFSEYYPYMDVNHLN